jgi:methylated-DNA--[protein]-cysteine S-methyltransferase
MKKTKLYRKHIVTPIGVLNAMATDKAIYVVDFLDNLSWRIDQAIVLKHLDATDVNEENDLLRQLEQQLKEYFAKERKEFTLPIDFVGTPFQEKVWKVLQTIPYGKTISYKEQAITVGNPKGVRAVANANGKNRLSVIVPCHRVIANDGSLAGYTGGITRKRFLLDLECNK